jgi:hypothetical protein
MQVRVRAMARKGCWFQVDGEQSTSRKAGGVQFKSDVVCDSELIVF